MLERIKSHIEGGQHISQIIFILLETNIINFVIQVACQV